MEAYVVVIGRVKGKRYAKRQSLNVPLDLALGQYERLSDLQLREARKDLNAEHLRRQGCQ